MGLATFLNGRAPTTMRGLAWLALSGTAVIETLTSTTDSGGGATQSWANAGTVACRIDPLSGASGLVGGQINERSTHLCTMPPATTITVSDRIATNGQTFEVTLVRERTAALTSVVEVVEL